MNHTFVRISKLSMKRASRGVLRSAKKSYTLASKLSKRFVKFSKKYQKRTRKSFAFSSQLPVRALSSLTILALLSLSFAPLASFPSTAYAADTGFLSPTTNAQNAVGELWDNPANAYSDGSGVASSSANDERHRYGGFGISVPNNATIDGIQVLADAWSNDNDCDLDIDLSWNGGTDWTNEKNGNLGTSEAIVSYGGASDDWRPGSWTPAEVANLMVRVQAEDPGGGCDSGNVVSLDFLRTKVYYTLPPDIYSLTVNPPVVSGLEATLSGTGFADGSGINEQTLHIGVDWNEDGGSYATSSIEVLDDSIVEIDCDTPPSGCSVEWGSISHVYPGAGTYNAYVFIYHGQEVGADGFSTSGQIEIEDIVIPPPTTGGLIVIKTVDNIGGGALNANDFSVSVKSATTSLDVTGSPAAGSETGVMYTLSVGDYVVSEPANAHYTASYASCGTSGTIAVVNGATTTCTVLNTYHNVVPTVVNDPYSTDEDTDLNVAATGILANDSDADGDAFTAELVSDVAHGTLDLNSNGSFGYSPDADYNGPDSFTYTATDGVGNSTAATVTITINPVNDTPAAADDDYAVNEDFTLTIIPPGIIGNDSDADGDSLLASLIDNVVNGILALNADGSFTYTPNADFAGPDSFTYKVFDGAVDSNSATVSIDVDAVNDAPVADDASFSTDEDTMLSDAVSADDIDDSSLTYILVSGAAHGVVVLDSDGSFTYTPTTDYNGPDSFTFKANDGDVDSNLATVSITVNPVNDAPVTNDDAYSTAEDTELNISTPGVLGNDTDVEDDGLTAVLGSGVANGSLTPNDDGSFTYMPNANFNGTDSFTYKANDGTANGNTVTVIITVTSENDTPFAENDDYSTPEDTALTVPAPGVLDNDTDGDDDTLTSTVVDEPLFGDLTLSADGSFLYTPDLNYNGTDSFTYRANDGTTDSGEGVVMLTIDPVNDVPVALDDSLTTDEDTSLSDSVLATDIDGDLLTYAKMSDPLHGSLTLNSDGSFEYAPTADYNGPDSFTFMANDGTDDSNVATISITVGAIADSQCDDELDNDGDGLIDFGDDPNCSSITDPWEDGVEPTSSFDNDRGYQIIDTEATSIPLTGSSTDAPAVGGSGVAGATMTLYQLADEETMSADGFFDVSGEEEISPFQSLTCDTQTGVEIELVALSLTSTGPLSVSWEHNFEIPSRGVYCAIVHATDAAENVENTAVAGPFAYTFKPAPPAPSSGGGGGGSSSGSCSAGFTFNPQTLQCDPSGQVLGASIAPGGQVLGETCSPLLTQYLKKGSPKNDPAQVTQLQQFLIDNGFASFAAPTGFFGSQTQAAVNSFQSAHARDVLNPWNINAPTGLVYLTTRRAINLLFCSQLATVPMPELVPWNLNPNAQ